MSDIDESLTPISVHRRRRGVTKASVTRLSTRLAELETKIDDPLTLGHAHKLVTKLDSLDSEFKGHHFPIVNLIAEDKHLDANLAKEQDELDNHDTMLADLSLRLDSLILTCSLNVDTVTQSRFTQTNEPERKTAPYLLRVRKTHWNAR